MCESENEEGDENIDIDSLEAGSIDIREFARHYGVNLAFTQDKEDEDMEAPEHWFVYRRIVNTYVWYLEEGCVSSG